MRRHIALFKGSSIIGADTTTRPEGAEVEQSLLVMRTAAQRGLPVEP